MYTYIFVSSGFIILGLSFTFLTYLLYREVQVIQQSDIYLQGVLHVLLFLCFLNCAIAKEL